MGHTRAIPKPAVRDNGQGIPGTGPLCWQVGGDDDDGDEDFAGKLCVAQVGAATTPVLGVSTPDREGGPRRGEPRESPGLGHQLGQPTSATLTVAPRGSRERRRRRHPVARTGAAGSACKCSTVIQAKP